MEKSMKNVRHIETPDEFVRWATDARKGQRVCYFQGWLMFDRMTRPHEELYGGAALTPYKTCNKAWDFYKLGVVTLVQKKIGIEHYFYIAEKV
jgi:hypothetical protein